MVHRLWNPIVMVALLMHKMVNAMIIKHSLPSLYEAVRTEKSRWAASFLKCCLIVYLFICFYREKGKEGGEIVTKKKKEIMEEGRKNLDKSLTT